MKDFISLLDYSHEELVEVLNRADVLREKWQHNQMPRSLEHRQVGLWFYGQGFRNRLAFEIGARSMGGQVAYVPGDLGVHEPLEDIGHYLANWFSLLVVRAARHADLTALAASTSIPVINARTDRGHPCEITGDLQFIRQYRGHLDDLKVVFVGEAGNMCLTWLEAAARFPIQVTQVAPEGYRAPDALIDRLNTGAKGHVSTTSNLDAALDGADMIYTDTFPRANDAFTAEHIRVTFLPYQITAAHLARLKPGAMFLPCPPVKRGEEVSAEAMQSPLCLNYRAKEFLLHSQNAIMEMLAK